MSDKEKLAKWMMRHEYATGHGDTIEDLLEELKWQIAERCERVIDLERKACAMVAESYEPECDTCPSGVSNAIRARGKNDV